MTLAQIARASGVATSTVSHILNNRVGCYASESTRQRVISIAQSLGYRPNMAARALRGGTTATLGLLTGAIDLEVAAARYIAFEHAARKAGYLTMMSFNDPDDVALEDRLIQLMRDRCVDGIVIRPVDRSDNTQLRAMIQMGYPIVTLHGQASLGDVCDVDMDYVAGGMLQGRHLIELGRKRICLVMRGIMNRMVDQRIAGLRQALEKADCPPIITLLLRSDTTSGNLTDAVDQAQMLRFFRENRGKFDAVVGSNDEFALGAMRAAAKAGLRVPDDVAIVGFDNSSASRHATIPITTIADPSEAIGQKALELISQLVEHKRAPKEIERVLLEPQLIIRASTMGTTNKL